MSGDTDFIRHRVLREHGDSMQATMTIRLPRSYPRTAALTIFTPMTT